MKFIKIVGNHNENTDEKNDIKNNTIKYTAEFIKEISKGFISAGINNEIIIYNESFEKLEKRNFKNPIKNICELKTIKNFGLIICLKYNLHFFDLKNFTLKNIILEDSEKPNFSFFLKINESECLICFKEEAIYYSDLFSDIVKTNQNRIKIKSVKNAIRLNNKYSALIICNICSRQNEIRFYKNNLNKLMNKMVRKENCSLVSTINGLTVMPREEIDLNNKILLCACKKYLKYQKNGILLVNLEFKENEINDFNINSHFYSTGHFEVYCFCPLLIIKNNKIINKNDLKIIDTEYFLVGGFNLDKNKGEIKLYKVFYGNNFSENKIEY